MFVAFRNIKFQVNLKKFFFSFNLKKYEKKISSPKDKLKTRMMCVIIVMTSICQKII